MLKYFLILIILLMFGISAFAGVLADSLLDYKDIQNYNGWEYLDTNNNKLVFNNNNWVPASGESIPMVGYNGCHPSKNAGCKIRWNSNYDGLVEISGYFADTSVGEGDNGVKAKIFVDGVCVYSSVIGVGGGAVNYSLNKAVSRGSKIDITIDSINGNDAFDGTGFVMRVTSLENEKIKGYNLAKYYDFVDKNSNYWPSDEGYASFINLDKIKDKYVFDYKAGSLNVLAKDNITLQYKVHDIKLYGDEIIKLVYKNNSNAKVDYSLHLCDGVRWKWSNETFYSPFACKIPKSLATSEKPIYIIGNKSAIPIKQGEYEVIESVIPKTLKNKSILDFNINLSGGNVDLVKVLIYRKNINNKLTADKILATPPKNIVKVEKYNGVMTFMENGKPINMLGFASMLQQQYGDYTKFIKETSSDVMMLITPVGEHPLLGFYPATWLGPDHYDFSYLDEQAMDVLKVKPNIKFVISVPIDGACWWTYENPKDSINVKFGVANQYSEKWKVDARNAVRQLVAHIQTSPYANNIIAYELYNGHTLDVNFDVDYDSMATLKEFRKFLKEKYKTGDELEKVWGVSSFDTPLIERYVNEEFPLATMQSPLLVDPKTRGKFLDGKEFRQFAFESVLIDFGKWIKEATHNRVLVGARSGNFMGNIWPWEPDKQDISEVWPMNPIKNTLESKYFDYFDVQEPYIGRSKLGDSGSGVPITLPQALGAYNKVVVIQDDIPHLVNRPDVNNDKFYLKEMKRRIYANALIRGMYPYEWRMAHYDLEQDFLLKTFKEIKQITDKGFKLDRSSVADVAIVYDVDYQKYIGTDEQRNNPSRGDVLFDELKFTWDRAGFAYDMIFLDQIPKMKKYKLYIFVHTLAVTDRQLEILENNVLKDNNGAIFVWADGYTNGKEISARYQSKVVGMDIKSLSENRSFKMTPADWFKKEVSISSDYPMGTLSLRTASEPDSINWTYSPTFIVNDPMAKPIAYYENTNDVSVAIKEDKDYFTIYSASPVLSPSLLRYAAKKAKVFEYINSEDILYANKSFICVMPKDDKNISLNLKEPSYVYDIFNNIEYSKGNKIEFAHKKDTTYLFYLGTKTSWLKL